MLGALRSAANTGPVAVAEAEAGPPRWTRALLPRRGPVLISPAGPAHRGRLGIPTAADPTGAPGPARHRLQSTTFILIGKYINPDRGHPVETAPAADCPRAQSPLLPSTTPRRAPGAVESERLCRKAIKGLPRCRGLGLACSDLCPSPIALGIFDSDERTRWAAGC